MTASHRGTDALVALRQIVRAIERDSRELAKASGLSPSKLIVLQILENGGECSSSDLADQTTLSHATITTLVDSLVERELAVRRKPQQDKRKTLISITPAGADLLQSAPDILTAHFLARFSGLKDWEQAFLLAALEQVSEIMNADAIDAAPILDIGSICS